MSVELKGTEAGQPSLRIQRVSPASGVYIVNTQAGTLSSISRALLLHLGLIAILLVSWQQNTQLRTYFAMIEQDNNKETKSRASVHAYLLISPLPTKIDINKSTNAVKKTETVKQRLNETKKIEPIMIVDATVVKTVEVKIPQLKEVTQKEPSTINKAALAVKPTVITEPDSFNRVQQYTQSYMAQERHSDINELSVEQANRYTEKRSMSDLDADLFPLWVSESKPTAAQRMEKTYNLGLELDPNRKVRIGDTCYQVVKVGNQVNPYAENLGYAFHCGGDKVKQQLDELIAERLKKIR